MATKVYGMDVNTGKIVYENPGTTKGQKAKIARLGILQEQFDKLLNLANIDGFSADGDTAKGISAQNTRQVQNYVRLAVDALILKRAEDLIES